MKITWEQAMPIYIDSLQNGNEEQIAIAIEELTRLAKEVDAANEN